VCKHFYEPEPFVKPLEKIEMKKTLVAVAAIFAVTGAMADATIYGVMDQAIQSDKVTLGTTAANTKRGLTSSLNGGSAVGFKGSEDLGGGLKASFLIELGLEPSDQYNNYSATTARSLSAIASTDDSFSNGIGNRQSFLGLEGGFGSINLGRQYTNTFLAACGGDIGGCANLVGNLAIFSVLDTSTDVRRANQINYNLPSLVPGLSIQVGKSYGEAVKVGTNTTNNAGDGTNYTLGYSSGPFAATLASETVDNAGGPGMFANTPAASTTSKRKASVTGLSYDAGVAKVTYTAAKTTVGAGATSKGSNVGISVPFGAASIGYQAGTGETNASGATVSKLKASQVAFNYSLSKRTVAYVRVASQAESTAAGVNTVKINQSALGVIHNF
jgi:predicted porin